jgi:uncharacterized coiled-coil protein SlyX
MATRRKNGDDIPHLTLMVLHEIRDTLRSHGDRLDRMDQRLDALNQSVIDLNHSVIETNRALYETNRAVDRLTARFEIEVRLTRLEGRVPT